MSIALHGVPVSRGVAVGPVHLLQRDDIEVVEVTLAADRIEGEVARYCAALDEARRQLQAVRGQIPVGAPGEVSAFIDAHLLMLEDSVLSVEPPRIMRERRCNAEWALREQRDALVQVFEEMEDPYLRTRRDDVDHVVNRVLRILMRHELMPHELGAASLDDVIVVADDLTPADAVLLQSQRIAGFATEHGGPTSHTAILARSLGIPAIVGLQFGRRLVREDDLVVLDGRSGVVVVEPDERTLAHYRMRKREERRYYTELMGLRELPSVTRDGVPITLYANVELPRDFAAVRRVGAEGVGLHRTEFLYMNRAAPPGEQEQFDAYVAMFGELGTVPVTIRTVDIGSDKEVTGGWLHAPVGANPALGLRGVRLTLRDPALFRPQLRAILRASAFGPVRMMLPMLSSVQEVDEVLAVVAAISAELDAEGVEYDPSMPIGGMIEVPAAALCAEAFARRLDFLSIGTNDLIQYTLAIDRADDAVSHLYEPAHPAVLRLIHEVIRAGRAAGKPVAMCGEMAGDVRYVGLLLALGLREFSVHPASLLEVKRLVRETTLAPLEALAPRLIAAASPLEALALVATEGERRSAPRG